MALLTHNSHLLDSDGRPLSSLQAINRLDEPEKEHIYSRLLPQRLRDVLGLEPNSLCNSAGERLVTVIAPKGLSLVRIEGRSQPHGGVTVFFLEISDTHFHQMELSFCIIRDPAAPRYAVDVDEKGANNWFASQGRNIPEELRAMRAGLFPNQTHHGLQLFVTFFPLLERFTDSLGIQMIVAEPLLHRVFDAAPARWATYALAVVGVLAAGWWHARRQRGADDDHDGDSGHTSRSRTGHTA